MGGPRGLLTVRDDLALDGRVLALGATECLGNLRALLGARLVLVVILGFARQRVFELPHAGAQRAPQAGQALGSEDDEHDQQDDRELWDSDAVEHFPRSLFPDSIGELPVRDVKSARSPPILGPQRMFEPMNQPADNSHYVKRVVLPSGRAIEVVYFDNTDAPAPAAPGRGRELHVCPGCEGDLVYPVEWEEASPTHWEVLLRCPNCEWSEVDTFDQDTVDRFDLKLDRGTEQVMRDLKRLIQANMEEEVERFVQALDSDAIWPMDF